MQDKIKNITPYYGYALRSHRNNVPGMQKAVQATLQPKPSTDKAPRYDPCLEGPESWCKFNRAVAKNKEPTPHKNSLPDFDCETLDPVFRRLSDEALLERCSDGITHNSNESLHAMICEQVPKTQQASLHSTERAISHFYQGVTKNNAQISCKMAQNVAKVAK